METTILQLASTLGGFAGLVAGVMLIVVLRSQAGQQKILNSLLTSFLAEMVAGRKEANTVIQANTEAMTVLKVMQADVCAQLQAHDEHARDIGTIVTKIGEAIKKPMSNGKRSAVAMELGG